MNEVKEFLLKSYKDTALTLSTYKSAQETLVEDIDSAENEKKLKAVKGIISGLEGRKDALNIALRTLTDADYESLTVEELKSNLLDGCFFAEEDTQEVQ